VVEFNKWLQDLDPKDPPHLKEERIGGIIDLGLLLQNPQKDAIIIGGM
jgi:hypothetical protein